jgi:hypothetical protein
MTWLRFDYTAYQTDRVSSIGYREANGKYHLTATLSDGTTSDITGALGLDHAKRAFESLIEKLEQNLAVIDIPQIVSDTKGTP